MHRSIMTGDAKQTPNGIGWTESQEAFADWRDAATAVPWTDKTVPWRHGTKRGGQGALAAKV